MRDALASLGSAAAIAETRLAPLIAAATAAATLQVGPVHQLARDVLLSYDPWVRARVMKAILGAHGVRAGRAIRTATRFIPTARSGASIHLPGGLILERAFDRFLLLAPAATAGPDRPLVLDGAHGTGDARIGGRRVRLSWGRCAATDATEIDLSPARLPLTLRGWRPGDRIRLRGGSKKLKKLFGEKRLARSVRSRVPVLADAQGVVIWVPGIALAEGAGTGPGPRLRVTLRP
jgi:tRNA(Ile)-lysidine synthase